MSRFRYRVAFACALVFLPVLSGLSNGAPLPQVFEPVGPSAQHIKTPNKQRELKAAMLRVFDLIEAGQLNEAEQLIVRAEALNRTVPGRVEDRALYLAGMRARILVRRGEYNQAETMLKQIIVAIEDRHGMTSDDASQVYATLGELYMRQARWSEAERYLRTAVEVSEAAAGKSHPATADMLNSLAVFYVRTGRFDQAEPLLQRILKIYSGLGARGKSGVAAATLNLGTVNQYTGRPSEALGFFRKAFELNSQVYGPEHPNTMLALNNAGVLLGQLQRYDEALPIMERVFAGTLKRYGDDAPQTAQAANNVGWIELARRDPTRALAYFRPALNVYFRQRDMQMRSSASRGAAIDEREVSRTILGLTRAARSLSNSEPARADELANEAFVAVQRVHRGVAAQAFALASARFAAGDGPLSQLIRRRQDAARRWLDIETAYTAVLASPAKTRDPAVERQARALIESLQKEIQGIDAQIAQSFPEYAALAEPQPLTVAEARKSLARDEALVLFAPFGGSNGEDLFTFVIDANGIAWRSTGIGASELADMVQMLRCGLDIGQWDKAESRDLCTKRVRAATPSDRLPFSTETAHRLFATLFGDLATRIVGKTIYVVAPDPLASVPLQALITAPPSGDGSRPADLRKAAWVARTSSVVVLSAAADLRRNSSAAKVRPAAQPFIGFGEPKLVGSLDCPPSMPQGTCPDSSRAMKTASLLPRGPTSLAIGRRTASGLADLDVVRSMCPLPETALELRCVAQSMKVPLDTIHVGEDATLARLRATALDQYRVLHFATHGLLAGEIGSIADAGAEPALVLTPPDKPQPNDDGLLRASEIAGLKLNADWVILSACNTAAGAKLGGEAMSGLASAFFYAGARTLLASHWPVRSDAAVLLTTRAFDLLARDPEMGKAEAMRRSMVSLIDDEGSGDPHPSVWAPFIVAGEGGRAGR